MSADAEQERPTSRRERRSLERNRYFYGKLMTPRDMRCEQEYHRARLDTVARSVAGVGIVEGLETRDAVERRDRSGGEREVELEVTVRPGVAVDGEGRLLVVEDTVRQEFAVPDDDETVVHVFLRYDETATERVPTPDLGKAVSEGCEHNRVVETPEVVCRYYAAGEAPTTAYKPVAEPDGTVEPEGDGSLDPSDPALGALARAYREGTAVLPTRDDAAVFLGAFERSDGEWKPTESDLRPLVYTNDALYAALVRHVYDYDDPHRVGGGGGGGTDVPERLRERFANLEERVDRMERRAERSERKIRQLQTYAIDRTLDETVLSFELVNDEFDDRSDAAREIVELVREWTRREAEPEPKRYVEFVLELTQLMSEVVGEIERDARESGLELYEQAIRDLEKTATAVREDDADEMEVLTVVHEHDRVNETASWLAMKLATR
jgi:hypothetical protein